MLKVARLSRVLRYVRWRSKFDPSITQKETREINIHLYCDLQGSTSIGENSTKIKHVLKLQEMGMFSISTGVARGHDQSKFEVVIMTATDLLRQTTGNQAIGDTD